MSFRVFVVCEDHTLDQYTCVPVVEAMMNYLGKPRAIVKPVTNPRLRGISQVEAQFESVATRYAAIADLVVFALDRDRLDGQDGRGDRAAAFADKKSHLSQDVADKVEVLLAVEETEVWCLWGARALIGASWATVRAERDSKEAYFDPLTTKADERLPGRGRQRLVNESLYLGWNSIASGCPELRELDSRVSRLIP